MENILNDSTTWGVEADKINNNFTEIVNENNEYHKFEFTPVSETSGKIINAGTGGDLTFPSGSISEHIICSEGDVFILENIPQNATYSYAAIAFYDADDVYLGQTYSAVVTIGAGTQDFTKTAPADTSYAKVTIFSTGDFYKKYTLEDIKSYIVGIESSLDDRITVLEDNILITLTDFDNRESSAYVSSPIMLAIPSAIYQIEDMFNQTVRNVIEFKDINYDETQAVQSTTNGNYTTVSLTATTSDKYVRMRYQENENPVTVTIKIPFNSFFNSLIHNVGIDREEQISIFGDSTSQGLGSWLTSDVCHKVVNSRGVGGETTLDTCARIGTIPIMVMPVTIPTTGTVSVDITSAQVLKTNYDGSGFIDTYTAESYIGAYKINALIPVGSGNFYCTIGGVEGNLQAVDNNRTSFQFTRLEDGDAVTIDRPVPAFPTDLDFKNDEDILIILMGTDGSWYVYDENNDLYDSSTITSSHAYGKTTGDYDNLIAQHKAIIEGLNTKKFVIITYFCPQNTDSSLMDYYEFEMTKLYGRHVVNGRVFLRDEGWQEANITLSATVDVTESDYTRIADGKVPISLFEDYDETSPHLNDTGDKVLSNEVMRRMKELGYIDTYELYTF